MQAQPGFLDPTFGAGGIVITPMDGTIDVIYDICVQTDGMILAAGKRQSGIMSSIMLARYQVDGTLDPAFGSNGLVLTIPFSGFLMASVIEVTAAGRILVCGRANDSMLLARYLPDGSLDLEFDDDGILVIQDLENGPGFSMTQQPDGKILVAGSHDEGAGRQISVHRFFENGSVDMSFDGDGHTMTDLPGDINEAMAIALRADGRIVIAGQYGAEWPFEGMCMIQYNPDGSLDSSFDGDGVWTHTTGFPNEGFLSVVVQSDGKLLAGGISHDGVTNYADLVRLNADGTFDNGFGGDGLIRTDVGPDASSWQEVILEPDGKIIAVGVVNDGADFLVGRYMPDGTLDYGFGTSGLTVTTIGTDAYATSGALMSDGRILMAGTSSMSANGDFILLCFGNDLDIGFVELTGSNLQPQAYPNPVNDVLHVRMEAEGAIMLYEVLDAQGRSVRTLLGGRALDIDVRDLIPGLYQLRCSGDGRVLCSPILKL